MKILIKNPLRSGTEFTVLNNPFREALDLQFGMGLRGRATIRLLDMKGQTVMQWNGDVESGQRLRLRIGNQIPNGTYVVQLFVNKKQYVLKVQRE